MTTSMQALLSHPGDPPRPGLSLRAGAGLADGGGLRLRFRLEGPLGRLRIPAGGLKGVADELWRHTCFEAFVATAGCPDYVEYNFSPDGRWASYRFSDYRQRAPARPGPAPRIRWARTEDALELSAEVAAQALPAGQHLEVGLTAVIEPRDGPLGYFALAHAGSAPDFHHRETFALSLVRRPRGAGR